MGVVEDLLGFVQQKAQEVVGGITGYLQGLARREVQQAATEPLTGAETPQAVQAPEPEATDIESLAREIESFDNIRDRIDEASYRDGLVRLGMEAYIKMKQYQEIVRAVEERTGVSISGYTSDRQISEIPRESIYQVQVRFTAYGMEPWHEAFVEVSRIYTFQGNNETIGQLVSNAREEFRFEVLRRQTGRTVERVETEIVSQRMITERSLQSFEEAQPLSGEGVEL